MKLLVTGGTGFIGSSLCQTLIQHGHDLIVLTRQPNPRSSHQRIRWRSWEGEDWQQELNSVDAVINLAGEPITQRWSAQTKQRIRDSRVLTTQRLVDAIGHAARKPSVLISASAIGYYGPRDETTLTEMDAMGQGFLADICQSWEAAAQRAEADGVRVVRLRIGIVLGRGGGALSKMVPPFHLFLGGPLGNGRQWMSWVHRDDVIGLIEWVLAHPQMRGPINATAPQPVIMRELCATLGRVLHRPSWAPVPAVVLRLLLGEMADMLVTGQRVIPAVAQREGYQFFYPRLREALAASLN